MELGNILVLVEATKLRLEVPEPTFHVAVLPRAAFVAGTKLDFVALTHELVGKAQVLTSLVVVQDGWCRESPQGLLQCCKCQLTRVSGTKPPANHLSGFEVKHDSQVMPPFLEPQVGEILHPSNRIDHVCVVHASLWS